MGKILGRYILREVMLASLLVTAVLLVILLANQVAVVLERAAVSQFPQEVVLRLIWLGALENLSFLVPIGLLLGVVLAFGRLYHDSEMAAALACGVGPSVIYVPLGVLALVVSLLLAWLTLALSPQATADALDLRSAALRAGQFAPIASGKFRAFAGGNAVVYAERVNPDGTLHNVFVEHNRGPRVEVALAERAQHAVTPDGMTHTVTLFDGERFEGVPGTTEFRIMRFAEHVIPIQVPALAEAARRVDAKPTGELWRSADPDERAELHWRIALPSMCIVLTLCAVPIARLRPRQGRYSRVWIAIVIYFVYSNLISAGKVWLARGVTPPVLGLWWTHVVIGLLAAAIVTAPRSLANLRLRSRS
ncbi:MAG: LPS export ABC transporter permease LptF [Sinobacteraceae bacterium]|nr:LPS export ABC transporter permease LptF [Nevskiaceae bacterium]